MNILLKINGAVIDHNESLPKLIVDFTKSNLIEHSMATTTEKLEKK